MEEYYIGQIFENEYPIDAVDWCGENNAYIDEIEQQGNMRMFEIKEQDPPTPINVDNLTMTPLDFVNFLRGRGLTLSDINEYLSLNEELDTQLKYCKDVYCGVAKSVMPIEFKGITITKEMVEKAFKDKHGAK